MNQSKTNHQFAQFHRRTGVGLTRPVSKKNTNKEGITLISLVVTIIILLILAGVTLALISGSDGILGRATNALDENKIAMAKEQVELALSDFQSEFFDEKYVERTNNGTKKEYISEKLQTGVETTNFYAKASAEGNVVVYEGKDSSGAEVVKGAIQGDASIKWDDVIDGNLGGNGGPTGGESGSGSTEGTVNSAELSALNAKIEQLQNKITTLEAQQKTKNDAYEKGLEKLDSILTSQTRKDILYQGTADKTGAYNFTFPEGKGLSDYKMLLFYLNAYYDHESEHITDWIAKEIVMVEPEVNDNVDDYCIDYNNLDGSQAWTLGFSIPNANQFRIDIVQKRGYFKSARIYKVIGIY